VGGSIIILGTTGIQKGRWKNVGVFASGGLLLPEKLTRIERVSHQLYSYWWYF
jgi:hypothetical protein